MVMKNIFIFIFIMLLASFVSADFVEYNVASNVADVSTGQNNEWFYIKMKSGIDDTYFGVSKINKGLIGIGKSPDDIVAEFYLVPVVRTTVLTISQWYLCPLVNADDIDVTITSNSLHFTGSDDFTCYRYGQFETTKTTDIDFSVLFTTDFVKSHETKIKVNATVNNNILEDLIVENSGFAFYIVPKDLQRFRKAIILGEYVDLNGSESVLSVDKNMRFLDYLDKNTGFDFNWFDMPDFNEFSEIMSFGGKKGLLVGTYGYGASNDIIIDPIFNISGNTTFPSYHLINGTNDFFSRDEYELYIENSSTMSISGEGGLFSVRLGQDIFNGNLMFGFSMNELEGTMLNDFSEENNDADTFGSPNILVTGREYTAMELSGSQYASAIDSNDYDLASNEHLLFCLSFNTTNNFGVNAGLLTKRSASDGYSMSMLNDESIRCRVSRGIGTASPVSSITGLNDGKWHSACCFGNATDGSAQLYIDGKLSGTNTGSTGDITNNLDFYIGSGNTGSNKFIGMVDEVCGWKTNKSFNHLDIVNLYNQTYCINQTKGNALQPYFNQTINTVEENWSLKIVSDFIDSNVIRIWSMVNYTDINQTNYIDVHASGTNSFVNLNNLNLINYNNPFRVSSINSENDNIDAISLLQIVNDSGAPSINNCFFTNTQVGCDESTTLVCNISDDNGISNAIFQQNVLTSIDNQSTGDISDTHVLLSNDTVIFITNVLPTHLTNDLNNVNWSYSQFINFSVVQVNATDIIGNVNSINFPTNSLYFEYQCLASCVENWVQNPEDCRVNNTYIITYNDTNNCGTFDDLPGDNSTEDFCNYCSEDLVQVLGTCQPNSTQSVMYTDNNYGSCCAVTGLSSDCSVDVLYPYNETTSQACMYFENSLSNITCQNEPNFNIREKEYCLAYIPNEYLNESFRCISYVQDLNSFEILQTNPEYRERASSFLDFFGQDPETREYFTPANSLVNFYYTQKNLNPETDYILTIECSSLQRTLKSSTSFQIAYENLEFVFFRTRWGIANAPYVLAGIIIAFALLIIMFILWGNTR